LAPHPLLKKVEQKIQQNESSLAPHPLLKKSRAKNTTK